MGIFIFNGIVRSNKLLELFLVSVAKMPNLCLSNRTRVSEALSTSLGSVFELCLVSVKNLPDLA